VSAYGAIEMYILYLVAGVISFALLTYLFAALLKPEWF
jgi:K+-transporting ATPase KdpF subunit